MAPTVRQSSTVAVWALIVIGAIVVVALIVYPAEGFLRVWAVIGTLVGILAGALPAYYFAAAAGRADEERGRLEDKLQTLLAIGGTELVREAARLRPELFGRPAPEPAGTPRLPHAGVVASAPADPVPPGDGADGPAAGGE
jgi:hypothetical protein